MMYMLLKTDLQVLVLALSEPQHLLYGVVPDDEVLDPEGVAAYTVAQQITDVRLVRSVCTVGTCCTLHCFKGGYECTQQDQ